MPSHNPSYRSLLPSPSPLPIRGPLPLPPVSAFPAWTPHVNWLTSQLRDRAFYCTPVLMGGSELTLHLGSASCRAENQLEWKCPLYSVDPTCRPCPLGSRVEAEGALPRCSLPEPCPRRDWSCKGRRGPRGRARPETPTVQGSGEASNESGCSTLCRREAYFGRHRG